MSQKLVQNQAAAQVQQLSSLQVALASLVELPVTELAERVRDEMVDNAALEEADHEEGADDGAGTDDAGADGEETEEWRDADGDFGEAMGDYFNDDEVPDYLRERADAARERHEAPLTGGSSFYDDLLAQIGEHELDGHEREVMTYLIGSLDGDGLLRKDLAALADELAIYHGVNTDEAELTRLLGVLQSFEPRGIGARSLQECLHLQLEDPDRRSPWKKLALEVVDHYYKDFIGKRWDALRQHLGVDEETMGHVRHELTHLNPMPGSTLGSGASATAPTVVPDFYVRVGADGLPDVELNDGDVPELRVSRAFSDSISQYARRRDKLTREQREAYVYARQKEDAAQAFISLISRRRQTLLAVMRAIVGLQQDFFTNDDDEAQLHPLTLKEVAARAGVDISTVSRVTGSKYVQTDYGTYPLKYFFSSQFTTEAGDELSARKVRAALREIVDGEDKQHPLSDEAIAAQLKERELPVARRTVAKYREQLGIPPARLRRE